MSDIRTETYTEKARRLVMEHHNDQVRKEAAVKKALELKHPALLSDGTMVSMDDVYIVWFVKVLQNWKALVSTTVEDGRYYELTYNGDKQETYLDEYVKVSNHAIQD